MRKLAVFALLALSFSCSDGSNETTGTEFTFSGTVAEVRAGVDLPEGIPDIDAGTDVDADTAQETDEDTIDPGALVIDADEELDDCQSEADGYTVYFTSNTAFDPLDAAEDVERMANQTVDVNGTFYNQEGSCVLVADTVTVEGEQTGNDDSEDPVNATFTPGPQPSGAGEATPAQSSQPDEGTAPPDGGE